MAERQEGPKKFTGLRLFLGAAALGTLGTAATVLAVKGAGEQVSKAPAAAAGKPTETPEAEKLVLYNTPTTAPAVATSTRTAISPTETAIPLATATATEVPLAPTTAPTTAPTVAPTHIETEKPLLEYYVVFTGRLIDTKTQQTVGTILVSQLPVPVNKVLIFYRAQQNSGTGTTGEPFLWTPKATKTPGLYENTEERYSRVILNLSKPNLIAGNLQYKDGSKEMTFTLQQSGEGQRDVIQSIKEIQIREQKLGSATISDQRVVNDLKARGIILP